MTTASEELSNDEGLTFDLSLARLPVTLTKPDGTEWKCTLREFNGEVRDNYLNSMRNKLSSNGQSIRDYKDVQSSLLALSLFDDDLDKPVPISEIRKFPSKVQTKLYEKSIELNGLGKESELEAKNF